ncbi:hypothetical protein LGH70_12745 [Hymenobacter sp. BT635]|uniref:Uncharacterized protein n=1 Tax=Hymenobacter nitidus TaxID=2880929 RepID=A0ABS8ADH7_9BACT|nr:hypothetical protein [Hymenobacter nitidus]
MSKPTFYRRQRGVSLAGGAAFCVSTGRLTGTLSCLFSAVSRFGTGEKVIVGGSFNSCGGLWCVSLVVIAQQNVIPSRARNLAG